MSEEKECDINQNMGVNENLIASRLNLSDLKVYLRLKFRSYKEAARAAGISECRVRQVLIGYRLPSSSELITKIATGWGVDPVKLTLLFESVRTPQIITADKLHSHENDNTSLPEPASTAGSDSQTKLNGQEENDTKTTPES